MSHEKSSALKPSITNIHWPCGSTSLLTDGHCSPTQEVFSSACPQLAESNQWLSTAAEVVLLPLSLFCLLSSETALSSVRSSDRPGSRNAKSVVSSLLGAGASLLFETLDSEMSPQLEKWTDICSHKATACVKIEETRWYSKKVDFQSG